METGERARREEDELEERREKKKKRVRANMKCMKTVCEK